MPILLSNFSWMSLNVFLAFLPVIFGFFLRNKNRVVKIPAFILWLLFLPNTIYIVTDLRHFAEQIFQLNLIFQMILTIQYAILITLGIISYIWSLNLFKKALPKSLNKDTTVIFAILNLLIAFGAALGEVERANSWYLFTNPQFVVESSVKILSSPVLILVVLGSSLILNIVYFRLNKLLS